MSPTGQLVGDLSQQVSSLRSELRLAQLELQQRASAWASAPVCSVRPAWLTALIVAVVVFVAAGIAALVAEATPLAPEAATSNLKRDVETVKERAAARAKFDVKSRARDKVTGRKEAVEATGRQGHSW